MLHSVPLPPFALSRSLFFSRLPVSSFSSSQSNADGGEERGGEELSSRPVIRVSKSRTAGRNMHMMRRLKSIASGRSSVSDPVRFLTITNLLLFSLLDSSVWLVRLTFSSNLLILSFECND